jgi:hypothetical protein
MSDFEKELEVIKNFNPHFARIYSVNHCREWYKNNDVIDTDIMFYFGVILKDGKIDITKYPRGRIIYDTLKEGEHVLLFRKIISIDYKTLRKLYLRSEVETLEKMTKKDVELYNYIKVNCSLDF